ncbi:hypothetical protein GCM10023191_060310 [Actinoallomurus oryzae]|uniref:ESX-1 secretion-associated protein EspA/EspE-like domain-containing protein n=1 Tax=Actinoallomurus oryzae TaxID=502180 RepID=A0ABP8QMW5_9ACTN
MGITASDVITSMPSVWGATDAASAASVYPLAAFVAVPLAAVVSDPAQMWHAGKRYGTVAEHIRTASSEISQAVDRHASADHWREKGRDAFVANRVKPYQDTLDQAAKMYDNVHDTLLGCAVGYTMAGLASAVIGAAVLNYVASLLAAAAVPGANVATTFVANERMLNASQVVRDLISGLAKVNDVAGSIIGRITAEIKALPALTGAGAGLSGYYIGARAEPAFEKTQTTLHWPRRLKPGEALPTGYRAASAADQDAIKKIDPASITALGRDLDRGAAKTLADAYDQAQGNDVGYPGFGLVGLHLAHAHSVMREHAAQQLAACRDTPGAWLPGLRTNAGNWVFAEQANVAAI